MPLDDKISKIKIVLTDVDGVLTDGGLYYSDEGMVMKRFYVRDGMGAVLLKDKGIEVGILTSDKSEIAAARGKRLNFDLVYSGVINKKEAIEEICSLRKIKPENIAFIGDDVNDIEALKIVGFSACPSNAIDSVISIVHYVCKQEGGKGAFREFADLFLEDKNG